LDIFPSKTFVILPVISFEVYEDFYWQDNSEQGSHSPIRVFPALCNSVPIGSSSCQITRFPEMGDRIVSDAVI